MSALNDDLSQLAMSAEAQPLMDAMKKHIRDNLDPITEEFFVLDKEKADRWSWHPRQLELLESATTAAKAMDVLGNKEARVYVSAVKAMVPEKVCTIIDQAIQVHGATGICQWTPLAEMYTDMRHLRFADGPDEVHHMVVGRNELQKHDLW